MRLPRWASLAAVVASVGCALTFAGSGPATANANPKVDHVLLLSLDGFHDFDLTNYVAAHPTRRWRRWWRAVRRYSNASAQVPSDSFPGTLAMTTGGSPPSTGVYYDVSWDNSLSPAGSNCATRGALVAVQPDDQLQRQHGRQRGRHQSGQAAARSGQRLHAVYPHQYLKVNTVYEVVARRRSAHGRRGQAPELRDPRRARRGRASTTSTARVQRGQGRHHQDHGQRRAEGHRRAQRDRRPRPQGHGRGRRARPSSA